MIGNTAVLPIPVFIMHPKKNKKEALPNRGGLYLVSSYFQGKLIIPMI